MKKMPSTLMALPAGVATPPMSDAMGMPIITARPKDEPGRTSALAKMPSATAMKIPHTATSDRIDESAAVPAIRARSTRRGSVPARTRRLRAKRRSRPDRVRAAARKNIERTKKKTGLMKAVNAARASSIPRRGWTRTVRSDVTAIGSASVAHRISAIRKTAAMRWPGAVRPAGAGRSSRIPGRTRAPIRPTTDRRVSGAAIRAASWLEGRVRRDRDLDQEGLLAAGQPRHHFVQHAQQRRLVVDAHGLAPHRARHVRDTHVEGRPGRAAAVLLGQTIHDRVPPVGQDDEQDPDAIVSRAPESLDGVHRGAVAHDGDDGTLRPRHAHADGRGQGEAEAAHGRAQEAERSARRDAPMQLGAAGGALLDED